MKRQDQKDLFPSTLDVVKFVPASIALSEYVTAEPVRGQHPQADVSGIAADLGTAAGCDAVAASLAGLDLLVNNLGIFEPKPFEQIADADWQRLFEVNVMSGVRLARAALPGMLARNHGRIVFISSESGICPPAEMVHYGMTKSAQLSVARGLAECCAGTNVTVNSVLPGPTLTEGAKTFFDTLAAELLQSVAGIQLMNVPYKGSSQIVPDLLSGTVIMSMESSLATTLQHIQTGKLKALAVTSPIRSKALPNVPTVAESGYPGFAVETWFGLVAPAATPAAVVQKLHDAWAKGSKTTEAQAAFDNISGNLRVTTPQEFAAFIKTENARWGELIRKLGIKAS